MNSGRFYYGAGAVQEMSMDFLFVCLWFALRIQCNCCELKEKDINFSELPFKLRECLLLKTELFL